MLISFDFHSTWIELCIVISWGHYKVHSTSTLWWLEHFHHRLFVYWSVLLARGIVMHSESSSIRLQSLIKWYSWIDTLSWGSAYHGHLAFIQILPMHHHVFMISVEISTSYASSHWLLINALVREIHRHPLFYLSFEVVFLPFILLFFGTSLRLGASKFVKKVFHFC